jgi:competence protein ComEA
MDPSTRRRSIAALAVVLLVVVLGVRHFSHSGSAAPARAPDVLVGAGSSGGASHAKVVVDVVGAVRRPGLYALRDGSRIADAVRRAGGTTGKADLEAINLAAPVEDGLQVVVPRRQPLIQAGGGGSDATAPASGPVHLNTATLEQLDTLPGIGPVTAQKILDWRQTHGAFTSVDDLDAVPGIGPARLEQLRDLVAP